MTIVFEDVLRINVVLAGVHILSEQFQRDRFASLVGVEVGTQPIPDPLTPPWSAAGFPTGGTISEFQLQLLKERITLLVTKSKTTIERLYPAHSDLERLSEVTSIAVDSSGLTKSKLLAFGFNVEWVCRQDQEESSAKYIAEKLFPEKWRTIPGWSLAGEGGILTFANGDTIRALRVEPRANDVSGRRIYMNLNLHRDRQDIPERGEIWTSLQEIWNNADTLTQLLDS